MINKRCEDCLGAFQPSRTSQRFCSAKCANRQRSRRRRGIRRSTSTPGVNLSAPHLKAQLEATKRQLESEKNTCERQRQIIQSKLRSQAAQIDRLEGENSEQRQSINLLQSEVARLKRAQQINVQDLAHAAAWLVSMSRAKGIALDVRTLEILRRRGWDPTLRQAGAPRS